MLLESIFTREIQYFINNYGFLKLVCATFKFQKLLKSIYCNLKYFYLVFSHTFGRTMKHCLLIIIVLTLSEKYVSPLQN